MRLGRADGDLISVPEYASSCRCRSISRNSSSHSGGQCFKLDITSHSNERSQRQKIDHVPAQHNAGCKSHVPVLMSIEFAKFLVFGHLNIRLNTCQPQTHVLAYVQTHVCPSPTTCQNSNAVHAVSGVLPFFHLLRSPCMHESMQNNGPRLPPVRLVCPNSGDDLQASGCSLQAMGCRLQAAGYRLQATMLQRCTPQATGYIEMQVPRLRLVCSKSGCWLQAMGYRP